VKGNINAIAPIVIGAIERPLSICMYHS